VKSKDNPLLWIREWAYFLAKAHGCNAILFYDNGSTAYEIEEIQQTLNSVPGIEAASVIAWPYKFGPRGGPTAYIWDSDFSQYGLLEHARHRFLATAHSVLQTDIDELVLTEGGASVFDLAASSTTGLIRFDGTWVENATAEPPDPLVRRHRDYRYFDVQSSGVRTHKKWAAVPERCPSSAQWCVHWVANMTPDPVASAQAITRHFMAIVTNWGTQRWRPEAVDPTRHAIDEELSRWMRRLEDAEASQA
jgi:hypothetical protein